MAVEEVTVFYVECDDCKSDLSWGCDQCANSNWNSLPTEYQYGEFWYCNYCAIKRGLKDPPKQTVRWPDIYLDALRQSLTMPNFITTHPKDSYTFRRVEPSDGEAK